METNVYPYIFKRKSVRRYKEEPVSYDTLQKIIDKLKTIEPIIEDFEYEIRIVDGQDLKGFINFRVPVGLVLYVQEHPFAEYYGGMIMQKLDLLCSANGLGTCWLGVASPKKSADTELKVLITLAVGFADEPLHRIDTTQFRRLDISLIRDFPYWDQLLEAARVAPSATNGQPWYYKVKEDSIIATFRRRLDIKDVFANHLRKIDCGISCCHLLLALNEHKIAYSVRFSEVDSKENNQICLIDINRVL